MRILAVFGLFSLMLNAFAGNVEHTQSWGDLSIDNTISENTKSKAATPFLVQGTKVSFPEVSLNRFNCTGVVEIIFL